jgi:serine/threonine-protein kinase
MELVRTSERESDSAGWQRRRLRAVGIILCATVVIYFVRGFLEGELMLLPLRSTMAASLCGLVAALASPRRFSLRRLRYVELALLGLTGLFLAVYQYDIIRHRLMLGNPAQALVALQGCVTYVFATMVLYAVFVPNTPRRTATVVVPLALLPMLVLLLMRLGHSEIQTALDYLFAYDSLSDCVMFLGLGAAAAVYTAHTIHELQEEALKARQLGQYRLVKLIGSGGMGEVYLAEHQLLRRPCAIKLIRPSRQTDPASLERFEREVQLTAQLSHPNTIDIFDYGRTPDGTFYYVMEYLPGMNLFDLVEEFGPMPPARVVHFLRQTARALREAHEAGLIHRDIKPANIFSAKRGGVYDVAKLLDFGLVRPMRENPTANAGDPSMISGSPFYIAPEEVLSGGTVDVRSDIYSLGATGYYLLTGRPPFQGSNAVQLMVAHVNEKVVSPTSLQSGIPVELEAVILRCLAKQPSDRFCDAQALERALAGCPVAGRWTYEDAQRWWEDRGLA